MKEDKIIMLTEAEAAELLGLSVLTLRSWRQRKTGPPYARMGVKAIRYSRNDLLSFISESTVRPEDKETEDSANE